MWHKVAFIIVLISLTDAFECGVRKNNVNKVIVRGQQTSPGDWPWHVAIYHQGYSSYSYACGGTLLSKIFVLTADHCVRSENDYVISSRNIFVRLGLHNMRELNRQTFQQHKVVEDLTNQFGTAVGWGVDETDRISQVLKSQRMPVVSTNQCLESNRGIFRQVLDSSLFCAGFTNGTTVCNGDSGGGLHFERNGTWYVGGIVSFTAPRGTSNRCHMKSYAGFTDVQRFLPWIFNVTDLHRLEDNADKVEIVKPDLYQDQLPEDCGKYLVNRIYGGTQAALYEFPWMARLVMQHKPTGMISASCHGSLINKRYILTSAACFVYDQFKTIVVRLGDYDYDSSQRQNCSLFNESDCSIPLPRYYSIESIIVHPEFNVASLRNNVALVRVSRNINFKDHIQPICLPVTPSLRQQQLQQGIIAGWGAQTYNDSYPRILRKATVRLWDQSDCEDLVDPKWHVGDDVLCSGGNATPNTCNWDDGTPLGYPSLYKGRMRFVQYGIASSFACDFNPSLYMNVASYMDWILANLMP